jgi:large subunit ribosomal protein L5
MPATAPPARLKIRYLEEIRPALIDRFGYSSVMQAPKLEKITVNMGVGGAKQDSKVLKAARDQLATIAGQQPSVRRARKSIAAFKLREGMPVGVAVTLRSERLYEFLDRLVSIAIPRIRDFRGLNPRSFDGRGNYSLGVREQIIFPEIDYDAIDEVRGLDITITTSASTDAEAFALLSALGMPFAAQGRPAGFEVPGGESAENADEQPEAAARAEAQDSAVAEAAAPAGTEAAAVEPQDGAPVETGDAVVQPQDVAPAETDDAVERPRDAAPAETDDAVERRQEVAPAETVDAVERPQDVAPAEADDAVAQPPSATEPAVEKPKAAKAKAAKAKTPKPKEPKAKEPKAPKPRPKAKPAKAAAASAAERSDSPDSKAGDTAEKESTA